MKTLGFVVLCFIGAIIMTFYDIYQVNGIWGFIELIGIIFLYAIVWNFGWIGKISIIGYIVYSLYY